MHSIYLLSKDELSASIKPIDPARYRVDQIWEGVYDHFYQYWDEFSNLPAKLVSHLSDHFYISPLQPQETIASNDEKTQKHLFKLRDESFIESVWLKNEERNTICISTQVGCPVGCVFCATGAMGFQRNLSSDEIVSQVTHYANNLSKTNEKITNIVLMGMGEPFLNYEQTVKAVTLFNDPTALDIGARRITISTIGIPDKIVEFADIGKQFNLAISLHAPNDKIRSKLIPLAKRISLASVLDAAKYYIEKTNRRITYEYVLINNINDSSHHAKELSVLLQHQNCHVNLIALNKNKHYVGDPPDEPKIQLFSKILLDSGIPTTVRNSQGAGIQAGCGQLSGNYNEVNERINARSN